MRSRSIVAIGAVAILMSACGSEDACDRPLPYVNSTSGEELLVPDDLNPPSESGQKRIPKLSDERRKRSNPCSVGPPAIKIKRAAPASAAAAAAAAPSNAPVNAAPTEPLNIVPGPKGLTVEDTVAAWIKSWREGDAARYLGFYSQEFTSTDESMTREIWMQRRHQLLTDTGPAMISAKDVTVEDLPAGRKMVRLVQRFESNDGANASVIKLLEMVSEDDGWRIRRERVVEVLPTP